MLNKAPFEIITIDGSRFRCKDSSYTWQYGLVSGTIDVEDKTIVEVLHIDKEDEVEIVNTFSQVIMAGNVTDNTLLQMPTERRLNKCSRCGFAEIGGSK